MIWVRPTCTCADCQHPHVGAWGQGCAGAGIVKSPGHPPAQNSNPRWGLPLVRAGGRSVPGARNGDQAFCAKVARRARLPALVGARWHVLCFLRRMSVLSDNEQGVLLLLISAALGACFIRTFWELEQARARRRLRRLQALRWPVDRRML